MAAQEEDNVLKGFSLGRILLPVVIGIGTTLFLVWKASNKAGDQPIVWTSDTTGWMLLALLSLFVRDWMYMLRIRHLTDNGLSWWRAFVVIMLWEFSSALAPGVIGGGFFFAIWILSREGIDAGKSISVITFTSFLDGIFVVVMAPLVYFTVGREELFGSMDTSTDLTGLGAFVIFWLVFTIIVVYKLFVAYALFINPHFVKRALVGIFSINGLRRWRRSMVTTGDQLIVAAAELRKRGWDYWWPGIATTFLSWTARFSIVNCIIHAFHPGMGFSNDAEMFGKQVIMGIIVLLMPTPGGSGIAEYMFRNFLGMYITVGPDKLAFVWRLLSYYPYIAIGAFLLPRWVKRNVVDPLAHRKGAGIPDPDRPTTLPSE